MEGFTNEIWAYTLKNAIEFDKADAGKILPKLFLHGLEKKDIKKVMPDVQKIVSEVNKMNRDERGREYEKFRAFAKEREEKQEGLPELEGAVQGKVVTRLAPEPSKYNHIGHALVFLIQYFYAKKYGGKCIMRADDTNPEKSTLEFYNSMKEDLEWVGIKWDEEKIASDDNPKLYELAEKLIKQGDAFACSCSQEEIKKLREKMKECKCRKNSTAENLKEWKLILAGKYKGGERTLRLKGNMKSNNGVMRDPVIFRISYAPHFMQKNKYCAWPMYDFENPVEDALNGVTHIIRSKEFELRAELHLYILKLLGFKAPIVKEIGRYQITGAVTQGRAVREMIDKGEVTGWDDPRLVTLRALRRRGFVPEAFHELSQTVGLSKSSGHIEPTVLAAINRKIIDSKADRYTFIENPAEIKVKENKHMIKPEIEVPVHPDRPKEVRKIRVGEKLFLSKKDIDEYKGKEIRLLHLCNINLDKTGKKAEFTSIDNKEIPRVTWASFGLNAKVLMPDGKWATGLADEGISGLKKGQVIQFERFGFCRLDDIKDSVYEFWFTHK